ncbi:MAG: dipeptidase [Candidatus Kapaibacterium sp.]
MESVLKYIDTNKERFLKELTNFLEIPSISSLKAHNEDTLHCADWLIDNIKKAGIDSVRAYPTQGHPIVYAEYMEAGKAAPTVLIYGHYDVQPVDPLHLWKSAPFKPEIRNGKIYGRGTSDDKGQVFAHIKAIEAHLKTYGKLPVNIKLLIEGEEECGSNNLDKFIDKYREMLACDTVIISDTEWFAEGLPSICYGLRGISFVEVFVKGPNRDLHSGTFGGTVANPLNVLCDMISSLKDEKGRIQIPGFYDDVIELTDKEREEFKRLPFNEGEYKKDLSVDELAGEEGYSPLERLWGRPSLDLNGIVGGFTGEGAKTVLPAEASAKISMRLVPNQDSSDISKKIADYLMNIAPKSVKVEVRELHGGNPVVVAMDSPGVKSAVEAMKKAFGKDVVFMREGGSIPIVEVFDRVLRAPAVLMGLGLPSDNIHSPNESFALDNFYGGIKASAIFFEEFSKL